jgi:hypothetical protein
MRVPEDVQLWGVELDEGEQEWYGCVAMKTTRRVCVKDYEETDVLGRTLRLRKNELYLVSEEVDGKVIVFVDYVFEGIQAELFTREVEEQV